MRGCQGRATQTRAWLPRHPDPKRHTHGTHISFHTHAVLDTATGGRRHTTFSPAYPGCGGDFPTGPLLAVGTPLHSPHLALQVGSLEPARVVCVDDLHDMGAAEALLLHFLCCPDVGELDKGALLEGRGQGEGSSGS